MKTDFKTLMSLYHKKQLTPELLKSIRKDVQEKEEHAKQRHFKLKSGKTIDLIALKESILKDDELYLVKLPNIPPKIHDAWQPKI